MRIFFHSPSILPEFELRFNFRKIIVGYTKYKAHVKHIHSTIQNHEPLEIIKLKKRNKYSMHN